MATLSKNAFLILKYLYKKQAIGGHSILVADIKKTVVMPKDDFEAAEGYLSSVHYITGTMGGDQGSLWLTGEGVEAAENEIRTGSFWARKKDDILLLVVGGVLGSFLTLLVQYIAKLI